MRTVPPTNMQILQYGRRHSVRPINVGQNLEEIKPSRQTSPKRPLVRKDPRRSDISGTTFLLEESAPTRKDQRASENNRFKHGLQGLKKITLTTQKMFNLFY